MKMLLLVSCCLCLIANMISAIESELMQNLERNKRFYERNSMVIFGHMKNEENIKPRNQDDFSPVDELQAIKSKRNLKSEILNAQGDIIDEPKLRSKRRIISNKLYGYPTRWPNGIIPFEFDLDATDSLKEKIDLAVRIWHENTCIRFEPYSPESHPNHRSRVLIKNRGHCASRVGYSIDPDKQVGITDVYLPEHCPLGSVLHELGHVIGFRHEHTRKDRSDHVQIHYERIQSTQRPQYDVMDNGLPGYFGIYYDLYSIMHYSAQNGLIESIDEKRSFLMGQRFNLSFSDIKMANLAYNCQMHCSNNTIKCENEGFLDSSCTCRCPEHITGRLCETILQKNVEIESSYSPKLTCDFESDTCGWLQENTRDSEEWTRNKGLTKSQINFNKDNLRYRTGPQLNDKHQKNSTYIYLNSYDQTKAYANSILLSPQILVNKTVNRCLTFYYHMFSHPTFKIDGPEIGSLNLKLRFADGKIKKIWNKHGNQGGDWQYTEVDFQIKPPHTVIFFEAEVVDWKYGDIAIDDIVFRSGLCNASEWSEWSDWSECSSLCNGGLKFRQRTCLGESCQGNSTEFTECNTFLCPLEEWEPWSECSVTCGKGLKFRVKKCLGENCLKIKEIMPCFLKHCYEDEWSEWSNCSTKCGYGIMTRVKNCLNEKQNCSKIEKKVCFFNESCPIKQWSEWSEWSECSNKCGQGFAARTRECLVNHTCEGLNKELKVCVNNSNCSSEKPNWTDWSLWSNCITRERCSEGVKVRRRFCLLNQKLIHNSNCDGIDTETKECRDICEQESLKSAWSDWSQCSSKCGNGLRTRTRSCYGFKCDSEIIYDQKSCFLKQDCPSGYNYIECTFDKPEYCPLEQIEKGNSNWEIDGPSLNIYSKFKLTPSLISGHQFISIKGANKKSSIQTPIISNKLTQKGQCLSFYYFAFGQSQLKVNKVNLDGIIQQIIDKNSDFNSQKWNKVSVLLQTNTDYFLEFSAVTGSEPDSIFALDDISLSEAEECEVLSCDFDDDLCKPNQVMGLGVSRSIWIKESYLESNFSFLRVDVNQVIHNVPSFFGFPIVYPEYSTMCLNFLYLMIGDSSTEARIGLVQGPKLLSYIWKEKTSIGRIWKKSFIDFQIESNFQIIIEILRMKTNSNSSNNEMVALDNFKISYGSCYLLKKQHENDKFKKVNKLKRSTNSLLDSNTTDFCGGQFYLESNQSLTIQSPGYPKPYSVNLYCSYLIKTSPNLRLKIVFINLDLEDNDHHDQCNDYLEIRYFNIGQPGPKYCGKMEQNDKEFSLTSYQNDSLIVFSSDWAVSKTGFKILIKTI